jgi:2-polyprenyl-6-methoxyphenol hydroxylase-like FAD-dependent oxidoreductase
MQPIYADVAIVGAGPVGLTLALLLAGGNHRVVVLEQKGRDVEMELKANHISARSMELFRRLGLADPIRDSGLPSDYPHSVSMRTAFVGPEFGRIHIPCTRDRYSDRSGPDGMWPTPEPAHRGNVIYFGPVLQRAAEDAPAVEVLYGYKATSIDDVGDHVRVVAESASGQEQVEVRAKFTVGCEGGQSLTRHTIGAEFAGDAVVQKWQTTYIDSAKLIDRQSGDPAWATIVFNNERCGSVYAIDGSRKWLVHNYIAADEDPEEVDQNAALLSILGLTSLDEIEILRTQNWTGRRLLASRLRAGRVFLCGDSAHIWAPWAGYGMNAGLADAESLAWVLNAALTGWGGPRVLDAYEEERLPVNERLSLMVKEKAASVAGDRRNVPDGLTGSAVQDRPEVRDYIYMVYAHNEEQFCAAGLNFGYVYETSPCIVYDGSRAAPFVMGEYEPAIAPGARFPHFWLDGEPAKSLYDRLGPALTAVVSDVEAAQGVVKAAEELKVPVDVVATQEVLRLPGAASGRVYLVRPDAHLVAQGSADVDWISVLKTVTGR